MDRSPPPPEDRSRPPSRSSAPRKGKQWTSLRSQEMKRVEHVIRTRRRVDFGKPLRALHIQLPRVCHAPDPLLRPFRQPASHGAPSRPRIRIQHELDRSCESVRAKLDVGSEHVAQRIKGQLLLRYDTPSPPIPPLISPFPPPLLLLA